MSMLKFETVEQPSIFTRLDFRTKLVMILVVMVLSLLWTSPIATGALAAIMILACLAAGIKPSYIGSIVKSLVVFWIIIILIQGFLGENLASRLSGHAELTPIFTFPEQWFFLGGGMLTVEGTLFGLNVVFKSLALVLAVPLAILTTEADSIVVGMVRSRIPYKVAFVFASTLRFFPMLFEQIQMIIEAQRLRGLATEKMNMFQRMKIYSRVGIPLILSAMAKSQQLDVVLQSKGFSGSPERTYCNDVELTSEDKVVMALLLIILFVALVLFFAFGVGTFAWLIYR
jgi:energy-coupling factor transport system permease protein